MKQLRRSGSSFYPAFARWVAVACALGASAPIAAAGMASVETDIAISELAGSSVSASGVVAHRIVDISTSPASDLTFTGSSPSTVSDQFSLDCLPIGTPESLQSSGLLPKGTEPVKILGNGELSVALNVRAHKFTRSAAEKIAAALKS